MKKYILFLFLFSLILSACNPTKHLAEEEFLYNGASLKLGTPAADQPKAKLRGELLYKVKQSPNSKIFGKRFRLWVYQKVRKNNKGKGIGHWLKTKIGEAPVIYQETQTRQSRLLMQRYLWDNGFLNGEIKADTIVKKQFVKVVYSVEGNGQFKIRNYSTPPDSTNFLASINLRNKKQKIRPRTPYRLADIDAERERIKDLARATGFYEFDQSSIYFYLDTALQEQQMLDVYLTIKPPAGQANYSPHRLGNVTIYPDYKLNQAAEDLVKMDTIREENWTMIQSKKIIKLKALQEAISQDSGSVYSQPLENQAINYLLDLGTFKFVNLRYQKDSIDGQSILHRYFFLTPSLNQDFGLELEASTERSNFLGSSFGVNYTHRNIFRGAERFKTGLSIGVETQAGNQGPFINTLEANFDAGLSIPRLLLPFKIARRVKGAIPKTLINFKGTYQQRNTLFTSFSLLTELGYSWKQDQYFQHQFYPFQFTILNLIEESPEFTMELLQNPRLRASFDDLSIFAANYRFTYSNQQLNARKNYFYLRGEIESAGNLANLLAKASGQNNSIAPYTLFSNPIAQFARVQLETRYTHYQQKTTLVGRLIGGLALPYGNSEAVPYIRQFFVGGSGSIRAFRFRGVGPGSYIPETEADTTNLAFFDRVGDVKLEGNLEYRFPLVPYLNGAVFLDAGNVWLVGEAGDALPEGKFYWDNFYKQIAVGTGIGLRLDLQFVIIRFDVGLPLRDPGLTEKDRWIIKEINPGNKTWRKDNLKYNLAIGYPF